MSKTYIYTAELNGRKYQIQINANYRCDADERKDRLMIQYCNAGNAFAKEVEKQKFELACEKTMYRVKCRTESVTKLTYDYRKLAFNVTETDQRPASLPEGCGNLKVFVGRQELDSFTTNLADKSFLDPNSKCDIPSEINKLHHAHSVFTERKITGYAKGFFKFFLNPYTPVDTVLLVAEKKRLNQQYVVPDRIKFEYLEKDVFDRYDSVSQTIKLAKKENINMLGVTNLMENVASKCNLNIPIPTLLDKIEQNTRSAIALGIEDVNKTDSLGRTALMYVVLGQDVLEDVTILPGSQTRFAKLLLELGADPTMKDYRGNTALDYFKEYLGLDHEAVHVIEEALAARSHQFLK